MKQHKHWIKLLASEHKQLKQYEDQGMFSKPIPIPHNTNCLLFIWTYIIKERGTKKAHGIYNGSPCMKGTVTLGETYTASLDQTCAKKIWAVKATNGNILVGTNVSNACVEAPAPKAPLYMKLDTQFHSCWKSMGRDPILDGHGIKVRRAL